jgi:tetratricopeptide (TPR) repeat protein
MTEAERPPFGRMSLSNPTRYLALMAVSLMLFGSAPIAEAHGDLHERIQAISREIAAAPTALLHLKRGELYHEHEEYRQALIDYERAEEMNPSLDAIRYARARSLFKSGQLTEARTVLDSYLEKKPTHADAFLLRARVLSAQNHYGEAVRDFNRNLALMPQPLPECFLERAEALRAAGEKLAALESLDEGIRRQGNLVTLQNAAIALELELGHHDGALARVDRVLADMQRKESWLARRGEILEQAGRATEARATFAEALVLIDRLPAHLRETKSLRELETRLRLKLGS